MIYTELTKKAMLICYDAHHGVTDRGGMPYVFHPFHLAEKMDDEYSVCVALLHDVIEDTEYELSDIAKQGFPKEVLDALDCITRKNKEDYLEYIRGVKKNKLATKIKLADLEHNTDESRLNEGENLPEKLSVRYKEAKRILLEDD